VAYLDKGKAYRNKNRKKLRLAAQNRYRLNREKILAYCKIWGFQYRAKIKHAVFSLYGPKHQVRCAWTKCAVADIDMLALDHKDNDGNVARRENGGRRKGYAFYIWLIKEAKAGRLHRLQVLCHNHNAKKEILRVRGLL
jgi:hypothetical protein